MDNIYNTETTLFTIKDAIDTVAKAWDRVSQQVIVNCWQKTRILFTASDEIEGTEQTLEEEWIEERIDNCVSMERLFSELPYDNRMSVEGNIKCIVSYLYTIENLCDLINRIFICDNNIPAGELITDEEIIEVVLEENDEQDESNANEEADIRPTISLPEAFTGLKTLTQFLQYSTEPEIPSEDIAALYRVQRVMELKYIESLKQKTLDSYVSKAN